MRGGARGPAPGAVLLRAPPLLAAAAVLLDDLALKPRWPGWWSGKLADLGLCFFAPVLVVAALEWAAWLLALPGGRGWRRPRWALAAAALPLLYFAALQLWGPAARFHRELGGLLLGPLGLTFRITPDPSDLLALPVGGLALWWLARGGGHPDDSRLSPEKELASGSGRGHTR